MISSRFIVILVVVISGNPATSWIGNPVVDIAAFALLFACWAKTRAPIRRTWLVPMFIALSIAHVAIFGTGVAMASIGFLVKFGIAIFAVSLVPDFFGEYITVMTGIAVISLLFHVPTQLGVDLPSLLSWFKIPTGNPSIVDIGLHDFHPWELDRNCGMFWEPTAFAGYLSLAILLSVLLKPDDPRQRRLRLWLLLALLTTRSSTGYLTLAALGGLALYRAGWLNSFVGRLGLAAGVFGAYLAFTNISFLGEKIASQLDATTIGGDELGRIGNLLYDLDSISERPILGWSQNPETRFAGDDDLQVLIQGQGNGLTGFATRSGVIALAVVLGSIAAAMKRASGSIVAAGVGLIVVCALLMGEQFLNYPIFLMLPLLA